ncbi:MAG: magnesium chelatase subunit D family protein [Chloroflexota bacterium]|nr:magnesium chelatase subunit D family protein [Chloroflexota bacterium]
MTHQARRLVLPFTALVGQDNLKKALILNAINPTLCGVLIRGEKGTAKSTAVRSLAELLPEIDVVKCCFHCSPAIPSLQCDNCHAKYHAGEKLEIERKKTRVVDLPLGATEDRVVGTIDIEKVLKDGIAALQPGILAEVNQGILYIDEVNLLDDHLVDILLDSAAMGVNTIEREGVSLCHPASFILVGTMNPEEGELRPQLLDRFGLSVEVTGIRTVEERVNVVRVVEEFQEDPVAFCHRYQEAQDALQLRILKARELLSSTSIHGELMNSIAEVCISLGIDGHRADILISRTAKTLAAFDGRRVVTKDDIVEAADFVLPHRMRRLPFEDNTPCRDEIRRVIDKSPTPPAEGDGTDTPNEFPPHDQQPTNQNAEAQQSGSAKEHVFEIGIPRIATIEPTTDQKPRQGFGKRAKSFSTNMGKYVGAQIPHNTTSDIALDATLRASAARTGTVQIEKEDIREKIRQKKVASLIIFIVDTSGSMGTMKRMEAAKGAVMALLEEAYHKRDKVSFITFRHERAEIVLPPTSSLDLAAKRLKELPTGGKTPLPDGLRQGINIIRRERTKNPSIVPILVLVSDGKGNVPIKDNVSKEVIYLANEIREENIHIVVIDSEDSGIGLGYGKQIAEASGGTYHQLDTLDSKGITQAIRPITDL